MSLNLGNINIREIYLGSTKINEGYLGAIKVYSTGGNWTEFVNLGTTEYTRSSTGNNWISLTGMPSTSDYMYFTYIYDGYVNPGGAACRIGLGNSSSNPRLYARGHTSKSYPSFVQIESGVTGWTTAAGAPSIGSYTQDGISCRYCQSLWTKGNYARFKVVTDRINKHCYFYIANTLLGYATINVDPLNINAIIVGSEGGTSKVKNIKAAGFAELSKAQAWE